MWYGPPGRVPTPLITSLYSFNIYIYIYIYIYTSFVTGNLCSLPFHFILGTTGSSVCLDCFACVTLFDSHFCPCIVLCIVATVCAPLELLTVFGRCVLSVKIFLKVVVHILKSCGYSICWNLTYPIAFPCILPRIIGPVMLVTWNMVGNALLSMCRCKTHDPRLCTDCPP